ncbi:MAG: Kdo hydroxylase family protein [Burkholderiaceae bacterium]|nr:Kdo hydroxylase family protein [Burkholderiaceae bacterium]
MTDIIRLPIASWDQPCSPQEQFAATQALEDGQVLLLPQLDFPLLDAERPFLSPDIAGAAKNVSLNPADGSVRGSSAAGTELGVLHGMMTRFAASSQTLLRQLLSPYAPTLRAGRTSFRPVEIAGRETSWRKDDTRLHVDSFPSSPTGGERILRLFTNVHPQGRTRSWRLGESFEGVARRYLPSLHRPLPGSCELLHLLGITKGRRTAYDHFMLQLHDRMKADTKYQAQVEQSTHEFAPGQTWLVYTDQASHAAMAGQYAFEQTFYLPVAGMVESAKSPLRVLERLMRRELV